MNLYDGVDKSLKRLRSTWTRNRLRLDPIEEEEEEAMKTGRLVWDGKGNVG
jgi:hypothetical protein